VDQISRFEAPFVKFALDPSVVGVPASSSCSDSNSEIISLDSFSDSFSDSLSSSESTVVGNSSTKISLIAFLE